MVGRLRGMFSIAILDEAAGRLLLARDRFGIKPLFYGAGERSLWFASELNALRLAPGVDLRPDPQAIADYAALLFVPAPATLYRGLRVLEPSTLLDARFDGGEVHTETKRYYTWSVEPRTDLTLDSAAEIVDRLVEQAVARQLESDVPLGALLSGGIDSSLVSSAAQHGSPTQLLTFNVRAADPDYDETWAAQAVAAHIGSTHETLEMESHGGDWDSVTALLEHAGQPFADTSLFGVREVSRAMRRHVTVALSGDRGRRGLRRLRPLLAAGADRPAPGRAETARARRRRCRRASVAHGPRARDALQAAPGSDRRRRRRRPADDLLLAPRGRADRPSRRPDGDRAGAEAVRAPLVAERTRVDLAAPSA